MGDRDDDHACVVSPNRLAVVEQTDDSIPNWSFVNVIRDADSDMLRGGTAGCEHEER